MARRAKPDKISDFPPCRGDCGYLHDVKPSGGGRPPEVAPAMCARDLEALLARFELHAPVTDEDMTALAARVRAAAPGQPVDVIDRGTHVAVTVGDALFARVSGAVAVVS